MSTNTAYERRPIPGYEERYEIDTDGNVYAMVAYRKLASGRLNIVRPNKDGYISTSLYKDGKARGYYVHRLVMLVFQPIENARLLEVNHKDGNRANNRLDNLEWMTHTQNMLHSHLVLNPWNNMPHGERATKSKLKEQDVREIRYLLKQGVSRRELANRFHVSPIAIGDIATGKSWRRLE